MPPTFIYVVVSEPDNTALAVISVKEKLSTTDTTYIRAAWASIKKLPFRQIQVKPQT